MSSNENHSYNLRPHALTYFKKQLVSRQHKIELTLSVVSTSVPVVVEEVTDSENSEGSTSANTGRQPGARNVDRGVSTWNDDYINPSSIYDDADFARRFGIPKDLFKKLDSDLSTAFPQHWCTLTDVTGKPGIDSNVKLMSVLRVLTKGQACDILDDGARMGEETTMRYVHAFLSDM